MTLRHGLGYVLVSLPFLVVLSAITWFGSFMLMLAFVGFLILGFIGAAVIVFTIGVGLWLLEKAPAPWT